MATSYFSRKIGTISLRRFLWIPARRGGNMMVAREIGRISKFMPAFVTPPGEPVTSKMRITVAYGWVALRRLRDRSLGLKFHFLKTRHFEHFWAITFSFT
jgi:hypothetical protein